MERTRQQVCINPGVDVLCSITIVARKSLWSTLSSANSPEKACTQRLFRKSLSSVGSKEYGSCGESWFDFCESWRRTHHPGLPLSKISVANTTFTISCLNLSSSSSETNRKLRRLAKRSSMSIPHAKSSEFCSAKLLLWYFSAMAGFSVPSCMLDTPWWSTSVCRNEISVRTWYGCIYGMARRSVKNSPWMSAEKVIANIARGSELMP